MKITKIKIFRHQRGKSRYINSPIGIRIYTDEGIYGDGEAALAYGAASNAAFGMLKDLCPLITGKDPLENEVIWDMLYAKTFWPQNGGPVVYSAISAIDIALWDIRGKYFNAPVYTLLGGKKRDKLRCYASQLQHGWGEWKDENGNFCCPHLSRPEEYADAAKKAVAAGFDAIKADVCYMDENGNSRNFFRTSGLESQKFLETAENRVAAMREAVGNSVDIMIENHGNLDAACAVQLGKRLKKYDIFCYEEPCAPHPDITAWVAKETGLPITHGERLYGRMQFVPFFENHSMAMIQPDLGTCGGITEGKKIADMAASYDIGVQCHICASNLSIAAALQVEAAISNFVIHEHHVIQLQDENKKMVIYDYQPENGYYSIPDLPGMGNEWSEYALTQTDEELIIF